MTDVDDMYLELLRKQIEDRKEAYKSYRKNGGKLKFDKFSVELSTNDCDWTKVPMRK